MSETIGQKLRQARQGRNLSLEQAANETYIRLHYLEALERGDFNQLPSKAQARGFLRAYANYLGISPDSLLSELDEVRDSAPEVAVEVDQVEAQVVEVQEPPGNSVVIFKELGKKLELQREMLGFSLEEVERNIHIRLHYLEAIEAGNLDGLPSPVQGRGMLQNYAAFLGLDVEPVLLQFADGLQAQLAEKQTTRPVPPGSRSSRRRISLPLRQYFSGDWILGAFLMVALAAFIIWGAIRISSFQASPTPVETVPSIAEALQMTPEVLLSEIPAITETQLPAPFETDLSPGIVEVPNEQLPEEAVPETPLPTISDAPVQIHVSVLQRAWMRVTVDGNIEFEGRVIPGSVYTFSGEFQIELLTGNGAALQVFFNETDLGVLGVYGEVVYRVFTPEGVLLPTPTITPVPTNTPLASPAPQSTQTPPSP
ncbi:MAG: RodZ domain-containing protein [Anaerolineales bacterium]